MQFVINRAQLLDLDSLQNSGESDWEDEFPSKRSFIVRMRRLGIRPTDKVVCYSQTAETVHYAARALFILKAFGYKDVKMLSGSLESWSQAEFPTSPGETEDPFDGGHGYDELCQKQDDFFISMQDIVYNIKLGGDKKFPQLIDSTPERQRILLAKNSERSLLHIPNAVKMEIGSIMYMNGELKPPTELLTQFKQLGKSLHKYTYIYIYISNIGIILKRPIICYGYLANEACLFFLVLKALGAKNVKLYDRGFQEYHTNPSTLPLENYDQGLH